MINTITLRNQYSINHPLGQTPPVVLGGSGPKG